MSGAAGKICVICGQDCSSKPRIKDAHGHYACKACAAAKIGANKPVPVDPEPVTAVDDGFGLGNLMDNEPFAEGADDDLISLDEFAEAPTSSLVQGRGCPHCGTAVTPDAVICMSCGSRIAGGKKLKTKVQKKADDDGSPRRRGVRIAVSPNAAGVIGAVLMGALGLLGFAVDPVFLFAYLGVWVFFSLATWIWSIVAAFQDREVGWGITLIIAPFICFGGILNFWYVWKESGRDHLKACYTIAFIAAIPVYLGNAYFDRFSGGSSWAEDDSYIVEYELEPSAEAVRLTRAGEDPLHVDAALVALCDEVIIARLQDDRFHPDKDEYDRLFMQGEVSSDYPPDVLAEAVRWLEVLEEHEREALVYEGVIPED